jgi:hypothetical protein
MVIEKWRITAENIYNFDEKGFLMGYGRSLKRIMTRATLESGRITKSKRPATIQHFHAVQAGNQGLSCSWAKTESQPSTSRPRRRRRDRLRAIPTIEIREKNFTTQPSTFDLLLYIVTRSNTYPRLEERAGRKYKGEKGGLWLWSTRRTRRILVRQEREP